MREKKFKVTVGRALMVTLGASSVLAALLAVTGRLEWPSVGSVAAMASTLRSLPTPRGAELTLAPDGGPDTAQVPPEALRGTPEARLIAVYRLIASHRLDAALVAAEALTHDHPTFKLAQLVQADLLSSRTGPLPAFGGVRAPLDEHLSAELALLRDEARLRIQAIQERPPAGALPAELLMLPASLKNVIVVDASRSRLYLFDNGPQGPRLVEDVYISLGKQGVDKLVEGDQKTPLGVYFITDRLDGRSLEDRFGAGALPLNYPNAYDKVRGRTGSGILVHGVSSSTYSRPPLDSDGCIALANDDLLRLAGMLPQRDTPVIITRMVHWVKPEAAQQELRDDFLKNVEQWQQARLGADLPAVQSLYAPTAIPAEPAEQQQFHDRMAVPPGGFRDLSVLGWQDDKELRVVTFRELPGSGQRRDHVMRQYWVRQGQAWRIMAEGKVR
jgi:L,D-transpeptidase YnhG